MHQLPSSTQTLIFFAGVHGVGKTTACKCCWEPAGFHCVTASSVIKAAKGEVDRSKRVADIDANQNLLIQGIETLRGHHGRLLIDGHFVVMNRLGEMEKIEVGVFQKINPSVIVCLQDDPAIISQRLFDRDGCPPAFDVASLLEAEIAHGESVALICPRSLSQFL